MPEIHLTGVSEFRGAIERAVARKLAATREATAKGAHTIEAAAKEQLTTGSHAKGEPTGARPGEPPDLVSGTLRRSVQVQGPTSIAGLGFTASTGPTAVYGRIQELGGVAGHGNYLPARPYMQPAVQAAGPELHSLYREAWSTW